jgi:hypothetical protein
MESKEDEAMAELSMMLSHKLAELAAHGVTDPQELRRLALATFPLTPPPLRATHRFESLAPGPKALSEGEGK